MFSKHCIIGMFLTDLNNLTVVTTTHKDGSVFRLK